MLWGHPYGNYPMNFENACAQIHMAYFSFSCWWLSEIWQGWIKSSTKAKSNCPASTRFPQSISFRVECNLLNTLTLQWRIQWGNSSFCQMLKEHLITSLLLGKEILFNHASRKCSQIFSQRNMNFSFFPVLMTLSTSVLPNARLDKTVLFSSWNFSS